MTKLEKLELELKEMLKNNSIKNQSKELFNESRKITIHKYEDNTQWSVNVFDSYGKEYHLGYFKVLSEAFHKHIEEKAEEIWSNEVKPKEDLLGNAIKECIQSDIDRGVEPSLD